VQTIKVDNNPTMASCVAFTARGQSYGQKAKMDVSVLPNSCFRVRTSIWSRKQQCGFDCSKP